MKGLTSAQLAVLVILGITVIASIFAVAWVSLKPAAVVAPTEFEGEFDDVFLATKGPFYSDFTEYVDCNITNDVIGNNWNNCIYRTSVALNATADSAVSSRDFVLSLALDIDGDVGPDTKIEVDTGAGSRSTGEASDITLTTVELWTHEDEPEKIADLTNYIEDQEDVDVKLEDVGISYLEGDEYVLKVIWHTKTISPDWTTGDDIARITIDLDTDGDVDKAQILVESS